MEDSKFHIQLRNSTDKTIIIWLDDLPFSKSWATKSNKWDVGQRLTDDYSSGIPNLNQGMFTNIPNYSLNGNISGNNWNNQILGWERNEGVQFKTYEYDGTWKLKSKVNWNEEKRYNSLDPGNVLTITPPHDDITMAKPNTNPAEPVTKTNIPYQCNYQIAQSLPSICNADPPSKTDPFQTTNVWAGSCMKDWWNPDNECGKENKTYEWLKEMNNIDCTNFTNRIIKDKNWTLNCGGSGIYLTPCNDNIDLTDPVDTGGLSRIEYNINDGEVYFNLSGVEGINANYSIDFESNPKGPKQKSTCKGPSNRSCNLKDFEKDCPVEMLYKPGRTKMAYCPSPKLWFDNPKILKNMNKDYSYVNSRDYLDLLSRVKIYDITQISDATKPDDILVFPNSKNNNPDYDDLTSSIEKYNVNKDDTSASLVVQSIHDYISKFTQITGSGLNSIDKILAGCPLSDKIGKALCHLWWNGAGNIWATTWKKYLKGSGNSDDTCTQYTWAYDEMAFSDAMIKGTNTLPFDQNGNPLEQFTGLVGGKLTAPKNAKNPLQPLLDCVLPDLSKPAYVNIDITKMTESTDSYSPSEIKTCEDAINYANTGHCYVNSLYKGDSPYTDDSQCQSYKPQNTPSDVNLCINQGITDKLTCDGTGNDPFLCNNYANIQEKSKCMYKEKTDCTDNKYCYPNKRIDLNPHALPNNGSPVCSGVQTAEECISQPDPFLWCKPGYMGIPSTIKPPTITLNDTSPPDLSLDTPPQSPDTPGVDTYTSETNYGIIIIIVIIFILFMVLYVKYLKK